MQREIPVNVSQEGAELGQWLRRARGAIGMGIIWAAIWAPIAVLIGTTIIDPDDSMDEMWFMVGALPGFVSGVAFSLLLGTIARRRRLSDLSVARAAKWGAIAGAFTGILPFLLGDTGDKPWVLMAVTVIGSLTALSAASAAGSLALAQRAERREPGAHGPNLNSISGSDEPIRELQGGSAELSASQLTAKQEREALRKR